MQTLNFCVVSIFVVIVYTAIDLCLTLWLSFLFYDFCMMIHIACIITDKRCEMVADKVEMTAACRHIGNVWDEGLRFCHCAIASCSIKYETVVYVNVVLFVYDNM